MSENNSVFADDWREALEAHYKEVVRLNDTSTEETLITVMHDVGFTDDELRQLKLEATMRAEDLPDDFVPDLDIVGEHAGHHHHHEHAEHHHKHAEAAEAKVYAGVSIEAQDEDDEDDVDDMLSVDETEQAGEPLGTDESVVTAGADGNITVFEKPEVTPDENEETDSELDIETVDEEPAEDDPDAPTQMSMF